ncbi:MAG: hypothetical protein JWR75_1989 [Devosia sp.]|nr:hypothetical protein [Devosia sp.]
MMRGQWLVRFAEVVEIPVGPADFIAPILHARHVARETSGYAANV